jgi:hypothetical protein
MPADTMQDPRRQMQLRLDRIRHSGPGPEYFLRALQALAQALVTTPKSAIDSLSYRESGLELKITAPSLADVSALTQQVGKQGLTAEIQSSTPVATGVEAHLQLRTAGSKPR